MKISIIDTTQSGNFNSKTQNTFKARIASESIKAIEGCLDENCKIGCLRNFIKSIGETGDKDTLLKLNFTKLHPNDHIRLQTEKSLVSNPKFNNEEISFNAIFPIVNDKVLGLCKASKENCENLVKNAEKYLLKGLAEKYEITPQELLKKFNVNDNYWIQLANEI